MRTHPIDNPIPSNSDSKSLTSRRAKAAIKVITTPVMARPTRYKFVISGRSATDLRFQVVDLTERPITRKPKPATRRAAAWRRRVAR